MSMFKNINNKYIPLLFILCFFVINPVYAEISMNDAVNIAGKQRMLTQRMLKNYSMIGMKNTFADPGKDLQQNIRLFDEALTSLKAMKINEQVNESLAKDEQLWSPIKKIIQAAPTIEKVAQLQKDLDALLASCDETT
ncbi:MAG: type IV pili methyl-accepting chemotaxis transducer N-terminal domain-containing protein [gamma proteobacterium symbiont of Bathyaustriella thionipta]|nr:type IV pili methyl-accepting chemotaxis transducer N-terminal domain-containing protein [gamma proteobacterium symbiont of Bathyaustriella thionipta]MCU7951740.1 type IV pili methyl-accepting chemotaxis transducer N-terminal domain-containing protein [gamma proteobacterium symbiont of Bathyaustriella thionipta]MCU7958339.1 type IV pili methyl-accepting chemotaxis transducer N-terminal domain-containing protein [gamma proteobacterium symbiont of Bathyaustriella thionipta]MCU7966250.1 type IV 